jgi:hypothetical protein
MNPNSIHEMFFFDRSNFCNEYFLVHLLLSLIKYDYFSQYTDVYDAILGH